MTMCDSEACKALSAESHVRWEAMQGSEWFSNVILLNEKNQFSAYVKDNLDEMAQQGKALVDDLTSVSRTLFSDLYTRTHHGVCSSPQM